MGRTNLYVIGCVLSLAACRFDFDRSGTDGRPDVAPADAGVDVDADVDVDGSAGVTCTPASFDLATDEVIDVKAVGDLIAVLQIDRASSRSEILPVGFDGTPRSPIIFTDGSYNNNAVLSQLVVDGGRVRTCVGRLLDGFQSALFEDVALATGNVTSTRLCAPGVHCDAGCQISTHAPNPKSARISFDTNATTYQMVVANHDAQGNVVDEQTFADLGSVLNAEYAGTSLAIRTLNGSVTQIIAVDGGGAHATYGAMVDNSRLTFLDDRLYLLRGTSGYLDLLPVGPDAVPGAPELTVKTSAARIHSEPSVLRAGGATWLAWTDDGATAGLGEVDGQGAWREVASWTQAQNAWIVAAGNGVTVALDRGDHVTIARVCP